MCLFSIFLYLLRLRLLADKSPTVEEVPWAVEKNVYSLLFGWNVL